MLEQFRHGFEARAVVEQDEAFCQGRRFVKDRST